MGTRKNAKPSASDREAIEENTTQAEAESQLSEGAASEAEPTAPSESQDAKEVTGRRKRRWLPSFDDPFN